MLLSYSNHFRGLRERERQRFDDIKKSRARLRGSGWNGLATWRSWNNIRHLCRRFLFPPLFFIEIVSGIVIPPPTFYFISNSGNDKNKIKKPKASGRKKKKMTVPVGRYEDECVLSRSLVCVAHYHSHTHTLPFDARFHRDFLFPLCLFSFLFLKW